MSRFMANIILIPIYVYSYLAGKWGRREDEIKLTYIGISVCHTHTHTHTGNICCISAFVVVFPTSQIMASAFTWLTLFLR